MKKRVRPILAALAVLTVVFVGPWPTYGPTDLDELPAFRQALAAIDASAAASERTPAPGRLRAGWAARPLPIAPGTPLAGYGDRGGAPSTGVRDPLRVEALVLDDGADAVAIVATDLLIVPENVAGPVRAAVAERTPLSAADLLFGATHTHSGPGAFAPGWVGEQFAGAFDAATVTALVETFTESIVAAYGERAPARLARGTVRVPEHVRNRARDAPVDSDLHFLRLVKDDGESCLVASYTAHATVLGADQTAASSDYPGALERALERRFGGLAIFLAGAVGSVAPVPGAPGGDDYQRAEALGEALAQRLAEGLAGSAAEERVDIASLGIPLEMPPLQVRITRRLRLSPFLVRGLGVNNGAWLQAVRLGDTVLVGTPSDFSGELALELKAWAAGRGVELQVLSFNGDYIGYVSPDRYYTTAGREGREGYEMYVMSWCGPQQGEFLVRLIQRAVEALAG